MKVHVTFYVDDKYEKYEKTCKHARHLLDEIIYDYQCGMPLIDAVDVDSNRFHTRIVKRKE